MNEMGKIHLQRNLCRYAAQLRLIDQKNTQALTSAFINGHRMFPRSLWEATGISLP